jgi:DNA-directed RNA polymerase subunit RPC12/RpoP
MTALHTCTRCGHRFELPALPSAGERLLTSPRTHISFAEYVYAVCPKCGRKDWANERRYLGVLGPRAFYGLALVFVIAFIAMVIYLGFFFAL